MDVLKFNELLRRIDNNDESALEEIYNEYCNKIRFVAKRFCGDMFYSHDILNEVLIEIWNESMKFIDIQNPDAWIYRITKNIAITFYNKYIKPHENNVPLEYLQVKHLEINDYYSIEFHDLLKKLDPVTQEIVIMKVLFKFTLKEIGEELNMPQGTVAWKYWEALKKTEKDMIKEKKDSS